MTLIGIRKAPASGGLAGMRVAEAALCGGLRVCPYHPADRGDLLRAGGQFVEGVVKYGNSYFCNIVKILKQ